MSFQLEAEVAARGFGVSLALAPGETVAVLGPNGAGKSTLLSVAAGLLRPDAGRAVLDGRTLFDLPAGPWLAPHLRGTVLLAQEPLLFPHLSVLDNVAFAPRSAGAGRRSAREAARRWLAEVDALELAGRRPAELSGGQAQRVAVARALAADPQLLLLDEPLAALDVAAAPMLRRLLKRVLAGRRAVIVTHDVLDALMLADRAVVLEDGRITEDGPVRRILERPRSRFAAGLAGLNLVSGTVAGDGLLAADGAGGLTGTTVTGTPDPAAATGQPGIAVFRPAEVSVFAEPVHGSPRNTFAVTVSDVEPQGSHLRVHAGGLYADITVAAAADLDVAPGMALYFSVKATAVEIYPA
ncbi:ATP-binding cassette domain-containing protein [Arthrobacter sp. I2-34]|uniref:ATP-binding cassette domain-containing protein n=1 Tax=Arthrobacter hankyongi TaxID=2904801 RepID=A0ABS9L263_9MICC|nr:ATP-binding cassette domain-containing protein [Arthrobacter hankyongi]MCG2620756.1 ATP-binding cassette domain-containing protein [Arthrobacter hankyongi]